MVATANRPKTLIWIAPLPPPYMGPSIATEILLNSQFVRKYRVIHINTGGRRPLTKLARLSVSNLGLALAQYVLLFHCLLFRGVDLVYVPISQTRMGYLRDAGFILLAKLFRKKIVLHLRGGYFRHFYDSSGILMKSIISSTLASADRMIVLGSSLRAIFDGLVPPERISVVPNGCNVPFVPTERRRGNDVTVLFLSNLMESKGFKDVLHSAPQVLRTHARTKYIFAGSWSKGNHRIECEEYLGRHGLAQNVEFRGPVVGAEKMDILKNADIFVLPTYYYAEGHPWVIVEAMAAALPIISTDQGCIRESVVDGDNGFIVPKKDPGALAEVIARLAGDPELRRRMGRRSRERYEANFTQGHFVERMTKAIALTLEGP